MSRLSQTSGVESPQLNQRISARLEVRASWRDASSGKIVYVKGFTENLGEGSALVNLSVLPSVGSRITLRLYDEGKLIAEAPATVIRVQRDPAKPLAALSISKRNKTWTDKVLPAAQDWLTEHLRTNYSEDWVN